METVRIPGARVVLGLLLLLALSVPSSSSPLPNLATGWMHGIASRLDSQMAASGTQEAAARGVLERLLPSHISAFQFRIISKVRICLAWLVALFPSPFSYAFLKYFQGSGDRHCISKILEDVELNFILDCNSRFDIRECSAVQPPRIISHYSGHGC